MVMATDTARRSKSRLRELTSANLLEDLSLHRAGAMDRRSLISGFRKVRNNVELITTRLVPDGKYVDGALLIKHSTEMPCRACARAELSQDDCPRDGSVFRDRAYGGLRREITQIQRQHNMRVNVGIDWQAFAMGGYSQIATGTTFFYGFGGVTTSAPGATTVTDTGQAWTVNSWTGHVVTVPTTTANINCWGTVISNSATVLTVDGWHTGAGAAATPSATATVSYLILPGQAAASYMGLSTTNAASVATDTTMAGEISTGTTLTRKLAAPVASRTLAATSYTLAATWTYDGTTPAGPVTIYRMGLFITSGAAAAGTMPFETLLNAQAQVAANGDQLTVTWTANI